MARQLPSLHLGRVSSPSPRSYNQYRPDIQSLLDGHESAACKGARVPALVNSHRSYSVEVITPDFERDAGFRVHPEGIWRPEFDSRYELSASSFCLLNIV